ncbi:MAG: hypothetical protein ABI383_09085 [Acidobacteriaceae bacterium]
MAKVGPHDPHFDPNCGVLRNFPGISDPESLTIFERRFSAARSLELLQKPIIGAFDRSHLQAIHKYIFQDVYPWAGEPRAVNISRSSAPFAAVEFMASYLEEELREQMYNARNIQ